MKEDLWLSLFFILYSLPDYDLNAYIFSFSSLFEWEMWLIFKLHNYHGYLKLFWLDQITTINNCDRPNTLYSLQ